MKTKTRNIIGLVSAALIVGLAFTQLNAGQTPQNDTTMGDAMMDDKGLVIATFAGGCFWCPAWMMLFQVIPPDT